MKRLILILTVLFNTSCQLESKLEINDLINQEILKTYVDTFNKNDNEIYKQFISNNETFKFLSENIPLIDIPNKEKESDKPVSIITNSIKYCFRLS